MNQVNPKFRAAQPTIYQIRVRGHLDDSWSGWFDNLCLSLEANGDMLLTGPVVDQAALYGLLKKVQDLGLPLIAVNQLDSDAFELEQGIGEK